MPRRRRCCPRRRRRWRDALRALGQPAVAACRGPGRARAAGGSARRRIAAALGWRRVIFTSGASEAIEIARRVRDAARRLTARPSMRRAYAMGAGSRRSSGRARRADRRRCARRGAGGRAGAGRDPAGQQRDRRDPAARPDRASRFVPRARCCSPIARRARARCRCRTPISSRCRRTSSAARRASARCWSGLGTLEAVGGQEKGYRRGTEDVPGALRLRGGARARPYDMERARRTCAHSSRRRDRAAGGDRSSPTTRRAFRRSAPIACRASRARRSSIQFDLAGIAVSAGSACSSGKHEGQPRPRGDGRAAEARSGFIRVSFGPATERGGRRPLPRRMAADRASRGAQAA